MSMPEIKAPTFLLHFLTLIFRRFGKFSVFTIETNDKAVKKQLDIQTRQMLAEVIEANLNYLVRFATIRIVSKADAEDVVHEAVKKILEADIWDFLVLGRCGTGAALS